MRTPTTEQQAILEFAKNSTENMIVNALAGTGKTTTIEMIGECLTSIPILYLVFNKRNQLEAEKRLPGHMLCKTQNALGHGVWAQATGRRLVVSSDKMSNILKLEIGELPRKMQEQAWDGFGDILKLCRKAKQMGYVPETWSGPHKAVYNELYEWAADLDEDWDDLQLDLVQRCLHRSIVASYEGGIEFQDQVYMPVLFGGPWPKFPLVIVDELQDWDPLGHIMLDRLINQRFIGVGDPWQSIYGFKGAVQGGMALLRERYNMVEFPLSVTWRVPRKGVVRANARVPAYRAADENQEGEIHELHYWSADDIPAQAAILCRNNAPLLSLGFRLLASRRAIRMVGFDIGAGLVRVMRKLGPGEMGQQAMMDAINIWMDKQLSSGKKPESVYDRAECLQILCRGKATLNEAVVKAEHLFSQKEGEIQLLSIHKSKGLEWDNVFHLDPWRIPSKFATKGEALEQELNCKYVAETRFKQRLYLVNLEDFQHD